MAVPSLTASQSPVPFGGDVTITVSFETAPAQEFEVQLLQDGVVRGTGTVGFDGEPTPEVVTGQSNQGWEIRASGGTLTTLGNNQFRLSA